MNQIKCLNCNASLKYSAADSLCKCEYCDSTFNIDEAKSAYDKLINSSVGNLLIIAETALDGGSYGEALAYYNRVLEMNPKLTDAWINKGVCILRMSKIGDLKVSESISAWKTAIKFSEDTENVKKRVATEINNSVVKFYPILENHYIEFHNVKNAIIEHCERFVILESALSFAMEISPSVKIAKNGVALCDRFVNSLKSSSKKSTQDIFKSISQDNIAKNIAAKLLTTKEKYNLAAAKLDPDFANELLKNKEKAESADQAGNIGCSILGVLFAIFFGVFSYIRHLKATGRMATTVDPSEHNSPAAIFFLLSFVSASSSLFFLAKFFFKRKKRNK